MSNKRKRIDGLIQQTGRSPGPCCSNVTQEESAAVVPEYLRSNPACTLRLVGVQEAAEYLAISVSTLYGWVWQRRIPFVKVGRALRFDQADLDSFIAANKTDVRPKFRTGS